MKRCDAKTEVYSRVVGFFRPVQHWNEGKQEEFLERQVYGEEKEQCDDWTEEEKDAFRSFEHG